jgi:HlyD family secretion protein
LDRENQSAVAEDRATIAGYQATIAGHRADLERSDDELRRKQADLPIREEQLEKGIITKARVDQLQREIRQLQAEKTRLNASITSLRAQISASQQRIRGREMQVEAAKAEYDRLKNSNIRDTEVKSPVAGRVVSMPHRPGDLVRSGETIATVEPASATMEPVVYVASTQGGRILPEMTAEIAPTTVKREEFGFMKGTVRVVGQYPVSLEEMSTELGSQVLAQELLGNTSKIELRASLIPSDQTPSGYEWSSSKGPPFLIQSGTRVTVSVVVDRRPPITYVLPIIKGAVGMN